jgi:hypothetical protein
MKGGAMKKQLLLTSAVCMISGVLWQGNVHAQNYAADGFSEYCSVWQGLSNLLNPTGGIIEYTVTTSEFMVYCDDPQTAQLECDPGTQNSGIVISDSVTFNLTQLLNNLQVVDCVKLEKFITPDMCSAIDPNLQPIKSSAHFNDVEVGYIIRDLMGNVLLSVNVGVGHWSGAFDDNACTTSHGDPFIFGE